MASRSANPEWLKIQTQRKVHKDCDTLNLRRPEELEADRPAFFVEIVVGSQRGSPTQRLSRATPWDLSYSAPPGRYACFPAWDWKSDLLPPKEHTVTVPKVLLEQVLETFRTGVIQDETLQGLKDALG